MGLVQRFPRQPARPAVLRRTMKHRVTLSIAVLLTGCGYVGPIQPPALDMPMRVNDLRAAEFGDKIIADFTIPALTTEGLALKSVRSVEVYAGVAANPFSEAAFGASAKRY